MFHDKVGKVDIHGILDQVENWLAATGVPTYLKIRSSQWESSVTTNGVDRTLIYDSRSGMMPASRSLACWFTASKNSSSVSLNRAWGPGFASCMQRVQ